MDARQQLGACSSACSMPTDHGRSTCRIAKTVVVISLVLLILYVVLRSSTRQHPFSRVLKTDRTKSSSLRTSTSRTPVSKNGSGNNKQSRQTAVAVAGIQRGGRNTSQLVISSELKRRPPDFIIIGARKCGTRALLSMISMHPLVVAGGPEIHYFDRDSNYILGLPWYVKQMKYSRVGQLTGEKSPSYFITPNVPKRIKNYSRTVGKDVKLLLTVRNPVDRVVSDYTQGLAHRNIPISDTKRIQADFESRALIKRSGRINEDWAAIRIGRYSEHLTRWLKIFPKRQLHIVNGDTLIKNPITEMEKVSSFLGLDKDFDWNDHLYFNKSRRFYCLKGRQNGSPPSCLGSSKGRPHPHINPNLLKKLQNYYRLHNRRFKAMTNLDVDWPV